MKKVKSIVALILAAVLVFALAACGQNDAKVTETTTSAETTQATENVSDGEKVKIAAMSGPTGMGIVKLTEDLTYDVKLVTDPTQIPALVATGEVDIAACPLNLAANIYKKTGGKIQMLGINTLGVLYVVTNGVTINGIKDLKDKTIYSTGEGATPEYILDYILEKNGLTDSVKVEFLSEHSELAAKVASGEAQIAVLPEPFVSVAKAKNDKIEVALSLTNEWEEVAPETELAMGCVIARKEFIEKNPDAVKKFIADNKASVEFVNTDPVAASEKIVAAKIIDGAIFAVDESQSASKVAAAKQEKASGIITRCNIVFIDGEKMQQDAEANFKVYFDADPTSVGGSIPPADIYYVEK